VLLKELVLKGSMVEKGRQRFFKDGKSLKNKSKILVLDNFGRDFIRMAEEGKLDPIVGREKEIECVS